MATTENESRRGFLKVTRSFFNRNSASNNDHEADSQEAKEDAEIESDGGMGRPTTKWSLGILNTTTHEVPGKYAHWFKCRGTLLIAKCQALLCSYLITVIILWDFEMYQQ